MGGGDSVAGPFRSWAATHAGAVRSHNEDRFVDRPDLGLWAVADGAGGHEAGDVAAATVAAGLDAIPAELPPGEMLAEVRQRLAEAHAALCAEATRRGPGVMLASTIVVLLVRDGHFACLWAGDSRAYLLRAGRLQRVTRDHSLVRELVDAGAITEAEAETHPHANVITRAVGADCPALELDKSTGELVPGDRLLLCSDGLTKTLKEAEMEALLAAIEDESSPAEALLEAALARRPSDNVTVVAIVLL